MDKLFDCAVLLHAVGVPEYSMQLDLAAVDAMVCRNKTIS